MSNERDNFEAPLPKPCGYIVGNGRVYASALFLTEDGAKASVERRKDGATIGPLFTAEQMREYARAALAQAKPLSEQDQGIIRDLEAMAADKDNGFWPQMLAIGALRIICRPAKAVAPTEPGQQGHVQAAEMARQEDIAACMRIASDLRNNEVVRMSAAKCASAIQALASPTPGEQHEPVSLNLCLPNGVMFDAFGEPRERYVRVTMDGSHCVMRPSEGDNYLADAKQNGDDSSYTLADVYLSEREFDDLPDFDGF